MFPEYNIHSTPLLILAIQGLIFAILLLVRYSKLRNITDLFLGLILLITVWHQTGYTIGFMNWYDTYRNTKINYFLVSLSFFLAPFIYFYVKSISVPHFSLKKKDLYHFVPGILFVLFKVIVFVYDATQPGFDDSQNGYLVTHLEFEYTNVIFGLVMTIQMFIYLALTAKRFYQYRKNLDHVFSNTYALQLNWIRNFLFIYIALFIYMSGQSFINILITDLSWLQEWWYYLFTSIAIIYVGMVGYFTDTSPLNQIKPNESGLINQAIYNSALLTKNAQANSIESNERLEMLSTYMQTEKPYLDPDLNLIELAKSIKMTRAQLSEVINTEFNKNFNDYINEQRVDAVKEMLKAGKHKELSLLGIAYDCGFNSKATFNRVFKKWTGFSPSQYLKQLD